MAQRCVTSKEASALHNKLSPAYPAPARLKEQTSANERGVKIRQGSVVDENSTPPVSRSSDRRLDSNLYREENPWPSGDRQEVRSPSDHEDDTDKEGTDKEDSNAGVTVCPPDFKLEPGKETLIVLKQCGGDGVLSQSIDQIVNGLSQLKEQCSRENQMLQTEVAELKKQNVLLKEDLAGKVKRVCDLKKKLTREKKALAEKDKLQKENDALKRRLRKSKTLFAEREEGLTKRRVTLERLADSLKSKISSLANSVASANN